MKITGTEDSFSESLQNCLGEMLVLFLLKQKPMYTYEIYIYRLKNASCIGEESKTAVAKLEIKVTCRKGCRVVAYLHQE